MPELRERNEAIHALYENGCGPSEIARTFGITTRRVRQILNRRRDFVAMRAREDAVLARADRADHLLALYESGMTFRQIGAAEGICHVRAYEIVRAHPDYKPSRSRRRVPIPAWAIKADLVSDYFDECALFGPHHAARHCRKLLSDMRAG